MTRILVLENLLGIIASRFEPAVVRKVNNGINNFLMVVDTMTPVWRGYLKANKTIEYATTGNVRGRVIWDQEYGIYVHEGTRYMKARPFARDAINVIQDDYYADMASLEGELA